jgi:hypothetical protein
MAQQQQIQPASRGQTDVDAFFKRNNTGFGGQGFASGGTPDSAYGIDVEREPGAFMNIYRVALENGHPANRPVKIRVIDLQRCLSKKVPAGEKDEGLPVFALEPVESKPIMVAGVAAEVAPSHQAKSQKRRKRHRRVRNKAT